MIGVLPWDIGMQTVFDFSSLGNGFQMRTGLYSVADPVPMSLFETDPPWDVPCSLRVVHGIKQQRTTRIEIQMRYNLARYCFVSWTKGSST